jgi:transcriptional regulator with GAF, ATPase, and Fis domain
MELNCANLPEQLVEAELFGYRKGAFTGADRDHKGLFEESDGGTLFLGDIGDIPLSVQNKLLKAIDEKQIKRLGTNHYVSCDVQIIAATSRDLLEMIREGSFREDLYCRLAVLKVETVPLRERSEDIPAFIDLFLREAAETVSKLSGRAACYRIEPERLR